MITKWSKYRWAADVVDDLPDLVESARLADELTQRAAGAQIGISQGSVWRLEQRKHPPSQHTITACLRWLAWRETR